MSVNMNAGIIIVLRDEKRVNDLLIQEKKLIIRESKLGKGWQNTMLAIGTFYSYDFNDSIRSFHLKSMEEIERSINRDGIIVFINKKQQS